MSDFKLSRHRVRISDTQQSLRRPFSAVLLSDLHNMSYGEGNTELLQEIRNETPALILIAGDMVTAGKKAETESAMALMDSLTRSYQVYYANGNHESRLKADPERYGDSYERYADAIKSFGVHLLENTCTEIEAEGARLALWGLELPADYYRKLHREEPAGTQITELLGSPRQGAFNILLAHHPLYCEAYAAWGADLTLSGHLHGGIVRIPFLGGLLSPQFGLFPKYDRGLYRVDGRKLIVTAGLGSHTIPLRVNNPPEIVVIDFT